MSSVVAGMMYWVDIGLEDTKSQQAAQYQQRFVAGVQKFLADPTQNAYVKANATTTVPVKVQVANLTAGNFVQAGTGTRNSYNQAPCALIYYDSATNRISTLVTTEGGNTIPEGQLPYIAANAGDGGGFISAVTPTVAKGAFGGWSVALASFMDGTAAKNCTGTPATGGRLATMMFQEGSGTLQAEFLHRDQVTGRPDLNTMNTPIVLSASTVKSAGGACTPNGSIARDTNGGLLSCKSGVWAGGGGGLSWKGSVANVASLPASAQAGDTYRVSGLANHVFTWDATSNVWQGLSVDNAGNFNLAGAIVAWGSSTSYGALTIQGAKNGWSGINFKDASGNLQGTLMMNAANSGFFNASDNAWRWIVDNAGNSWQPGNVASNGRVSAGEYFQVAGWAGEGNWCPTNGLIGQDGTGRILNCVNNYWRNAIGAPSGLRGAFYPFRGQSISCHDGYVQHITSVDSSGYPSTYNSWRGWVGGTLAGGSQGSGPGGPSTTKTTVTTSGIIGESLIQTGCNEGGCSTTTVICGAQWP